MDYSQEIDNIDFNVEAIAQTLGNIRDNSYFHSTQLENIEYKMESGDSIRTIKNELKNIQTEIGLIAIIGTLFIIYYFIMRCLK